jgi:hypothetical protein
MRRSRSNSIDSSVSKPRTRSPFYHIRKDPLPEEARGIFKSVSRSITPPSNPKQSMDSINVVDVDPPLYRDHTRHDTAHIHVHDKDIESSFIDSSNTIKNPEMSHFISAPSPITYRMQFNQPSTEYVPIGRVSRDTSSKIKPKERRLDAAKAVPIFSQVGNDNESVDIPHRHIRSPSPLLSSNNRPMNINKGIDEDVRHEFLSQVRENSSSQINTTDPIFQTKTNETPSIDSTHDGKESPPSRDHDDVSIDIPLLPPSIEVKPESVPSIPILTSRRRNWDKDGLINQLIDGIAAIKVNKAI